MILVSVVLFVQLKQFLIFIQERGITLNKFRYKIIKFKTMRANSPIGSESNLSNNIFYKPELTSKLSKFSNWLRKTGLDELPQLLNVVIGNMSLIGPRPLMLSDLKLMQKQFPEFYAMRQSFNCIPGISGLWQINGEREKGIENLIKLESTYEQKGSLILDIKLIFATSPIVVFASHSDAVSVKKE